MNFKKIILTGLLVLTIPYFSGCNKRDYQKEEKERIENYEKEKSIMIKGEVISELRTQEIKKNPEWDGLISHSNPTMTLGEDFYIIGVKTDSGKVYGINVLDGLNNATKKGLDALIDKDKKTSVEFPASTIDLLWPDNKETNFYKYPEQNAGSKYASRIRILPER